MTKELRTEAAEIALVHALTRGDLNEANEIARQSAREISDEQLKIFFHAAIKRKGRDSAYQVLLHN